MRFNKRNKTDHIRGVLPVVAEPWKLTREMFLSTVEVERLFAGLQQQVDRAPLDDWGPRVDQLLIEGLVLSGLRNSELCRLTLADTCVGLGQPAFRVSGTPREDRIVWLPQSLDQRVRDYVDQIRPRLERPRREPGSPIPSAAPLLLNERGRPYERTALYRRVVRILSGAGLADRASVQLLRHTYGYLAYLRTGGNLLFVQRQLGHAHPMVTAVYAEFVDWPGPELANRVAPSPS
jgi:site-specific recombinase XerD